MTRGALRPLAAAALVLSALPTVVVALAVRAEAAPVAFGQYSTTSVVRASATDGDIGASGGLLPLDSGAAAIDASLDNSPTAMALARPVEPGTTFATVSSQVPLTVAVPEARAAYPGSTRSSSVAPAPTTTASAKVTRTSAQGQAQSAGSSAGGAFLGAVTASTALVASSDGHQLTGVADAYASGFQVAGVLTVAGVRGHAELLAVAGGKRAATASTTVGTVTVAGQEVTVDDTGVHAVGTTVPLGPTLAQLTAAANSALSAAGISISLAQPIHSVSPTSLAADSGGLRITLTTPDAAPGTANRATITLGRVQLSESDSPAPVLDQVPPGPAQSPATGQPSTPGQPGPVLTIGGTSPGAGLPPVVTGLPPTAASPSQLLVAGHQISPQAAIAALGGWMALTLGTATYAVLALRRPYEQEQLCPCL